MRRWAPIVQSLPALVLVFVYNENYRQWSSKNWAVNFLNCWFVYIFKISHISSKQWHCRGNHEKPLVLVLWPKCVLAAQPQQILSWIFLSSWRKRKPESAQYSKPSQPLTAFCQIQLVAIFHPDTNGLEGGANLDQISSGRIGSTATVQIKLEFKQLDWAQSV